MYCACLNVSVEVSQAGKIQKIQTYATKLGVDSTISSQSLLPPNGLPLTTKASTTTTPHTQPLVVGASPQINPFKNELHETKLCRQSNIASVGLGTSDDPVDLDPEVESDESECGSAEELSVFSSGDESGTESDADVCPVPVGSVSMQS